MFIAKCRGGVTPANINQMHRNNGDGTFTEVGEEIGLADNVQTWSSAWADYDNDGDMDVVVGASSTSNGSHRVMMNNGDGTFTNITVGSGFDNFSSTGIEWAPGDFNNDGFVDVIGAGNTIMVNQGDWSFVPNAIGTGVGPMGDLNNDGFLDVVNGGTIYFNDGNENNWLKISTIGTESNKNGIGARITLYTASGQQIRDVRSGEGFRYMSSLNTHFGIGEDTEIERITVCWPSGIYDEIWNPGINQTLEIIEGENMVSVDETSPNLNFTIYPNPATDFILVKENFWNNATFVLFDLSGRIVARGTLNNNSIDVSKLSDGFYTLKVQKNNTHSEHKIVKR
ncbi:MAG: FG-GAP-like repeat-containing protein [Flavobacteriales bacterium]